MGTGEFEGLEPWIVGAIWLISCLRLDWLFIELWRGFNHTSRTPLCKLVAIAGLVNALIWFVYEMKQEESEFLIWAAYIHLMQETRHLWIIYLNMDARNLGFAILYLFGGVPLAPLLFASPLLPIACLISSTVFHSCELKQLQLIIERHQRPEPLASVTSSLRLISRTLHLALGVIKGHTIVIYANAFGSLVAIGHMAWVMRA